MKVRIRTSEELFPNLVLHVLACGGIGLDAEYGQKYQETLTPAEIDQIHEMAAGFDVTPPALAGPFFQALFQIPCYFPAETIGEIGSIYERMIEVIREGNLSPLTRSYPQQMDRLTNYLPPQLQKHFLASIWTRRSELERAITDFRNILRAVYDRHYQSYWPEAREKIAGIGADIKERVGGKNVVKAWESIVNLAFPYPYFHVILCEPDPKKEKTPSKPGEYGKINIDLVYDPAESIPLPCHKGILAISSNQRTSNPTLFRSLSHGKSVHSVQKRSPFSSRQQSKSAHPSRSTVPQPRHSFPR